MRHVLHPALVPIHQCRVGPTKELLPSKAIAHDKDQIFGFMVVGAPTGERDANQRRQYAEQHHSSKSAPGRRRRFLIAQRSLKLSQADLLLCLRA
jgi:hypothetical protein